MLILATGLASLEGLEDDNMHLLHYAKVFCKQLEEHSNYELIFNDNNSNIKTERTPILFGQARLYDDDKNSKFEQICSYNFFCVLSELTIDKDKSFKNDAFNIIYFVVPNIGYDDLTLLMDQSHEIWCDIPVFDAKSMVLDTYKQRQAEKLGKGEPYHLILTDFFASIGYSYFGKMYRIVFSDEKQFELIKDSNKIFNLMASEYFADSDCTDHQITLSETNSEYTLHRKNHSTPFRLQKRKNSLKTSMCILHTKHTPRFTLITTSFRKQSQSPTFGTGFLPMRTIRISAARQTYYSYLRRNCSK